MPPKVFIIDNERGHFETVDKKMKQCFSKNHNVAMLKMASADTWKSDYITFQSQHAPYKVMQITQFSR